MSAQLLDLLSARASEQQNGPALEMLARVRDGGPLPNTTELLAQLGNTNPMLALLAQQFATRAPSAPRAVFDAAPLDAVEDTDGDAAGVIEAVAPGESAEVLELHERVLILTGEAQALGQRLGQLADALGACGLCWGEDRECRACRGRGRPGYALPDEPLFEDLVLPAVRVLRAQRLSLATVTSQRVADPTRSA